MSCNCKGNKRDIKFEIIKEYKDIIDESYLPVRGTSKSMGYDLKAACDIVVPSINKLGVLLNDEKLNLGIPLNLEEVEAIVKKYNKKATLVPTGLKCYFPEDLGLYVYSRSSIPYKYYLIVANSVGCVESDYVDNQDNEGHIGVMLINLLPFDIQIKKGDKIAQAIFHKFYISEHEEEVTTLRQGGYGSTGK